MYIVLVPVSYTHLDVYKRQVTMSSIEDEELILCLQRNITTLQNKKIEPQEIRIDKKKFSLELDVIIGLCVTELLYACLLYTSSVKQLNINLQN